MKDINVFCFGFGQVAKNFINKLNSENYKINLSITSRSETSKEKFNNFSYQNFLFNNEKFDKDLIIRLQEADHILISIPPVNKEDLVIKKF